MNIFCIIRWQCFLLLLLGGSMHTAQADDRELEQLFENSIRPVLSETCFRCHGDVKAKIAGGLRVDSRDSLVMGGDSGPALVPGKVEESLILKALRREADVSPMPPEKEKALRADQIAAFEKWIAAGAPWPEQSQKFARREHWAFAPLTPPAVDASIDSLVEQRQKQDGYALAPTADKRTLIRRATFDLTGLPPTSAEVDAFEQDGSPDAFSRLVDRLLDSPAYGERWGRHWLDVVRYADTAGETADYPVPSAWRYRNYVIEAFNNDMPYDQFLHEQIAGDVLAQSTADPSRYADQVVATGYLAISRRFGFDSENYHHLTIQDTIDTLGQSILGLSLGCARCHDHKYDPISMQDYYGLYGIFDSTRYAFPGSEQKQKVRCLMPLVPPKEAAKGWRQFERQVSQTRRLLESHRQPVPAAVLRSLSDMDGDFELQAPAAGGSNGVLVPPWSYRGPVSVTNAAQSPHTNLYSAGKCGIHIAAASTGHDYFLVEQAIHPKRSSSNADQLSFNLDFRLAESPESAGGVHQILLGDDLEHPVVQLNISRLQIALQIDQQTISLAAIHANQWTNVQLKFNGHANQIVASVGTPEQVESKIIPLPGTAWSIDYLAIRGKGASEGELVWPALELDNIGLVDEVLPAVSAPLATPDNQAVLEQLARQDQIADELKQLVGLDSEFELQTLDTPPSAPWGQGPNSVVKILARSQSPDQEYFPLGAQGVHMPNRGEYDGFGIQLPFNWKAETHQTVYTYFDFRCADVTQGGDGSWRYYVGHGPGNSAAIELFFNGHSLFARSDNDRPAVAQVVPGKWYHVEVALNLHEKKYAGEIKSLDLAEPMRTEFKGLFASGWDGNIDYSFIDSYGHIGGVRPALDVDNYVLGDKSLPRIDVSTTRPDPQVATRRQRVAELKAATAQNQELLKNEAQRLSSWLVNGPYEMAYAVAEGTPHSVPIQLRGEPSAPGDLAPRSFIRILGGQLPESTEGSGRLELANWLTNDTQHLTARVMVNRLWQYHFGRGLVATPNDFGVRGAAPSNLQLLDLLAHKFIQSGWSIKSLHRMIMNSRAYQQVPYDSMNLHAEPSPDLFVGFARRRLSAEEIRDSILSVSGLLDRQPGREHAFPAPISWGFTQHAPFAAVYDHRQRSIYLMTQRLKRHPFLALFDGADPNASTAIRLGSTVPTQALYFLNDPFVHEASAAWATALKDLSPQQAIELSYHTGLSRAPTSDEMQTALRFMAEYRDEVVSTGVAQGDAAQARALAAWLRVVMGSNEFLHVD